MLNCVCAEIRSLSPTHQVMLAASLYPSPVGRLTLVASESNLLAVLWEDDDPARVKLAPFHIVDQHPILDQVRSQLDEYFAGERTEFDLPLQPIGTPFQQQVWQALIEIPFGQTRSYSELANALSQPNAARAVGNANRVNPISIIVPCHRVVGKTGALTGFAGGLAAKAFLLNWEKERVAVSLTRPKASKSAMLHSFSLKKAAATT
jgi:methylated-DNA-[protein]-cysteine S-methyltransferase